MAWGTKLSDFAPSLISDRTAKLSLTIFRIIAIFGIGYWLLSSIKKQLFFTVFLLMIVIAKWHSFYLKKAVMMICYMVM